MCPACIASAGLIVSSVISTGGVTAVVAKIVSIRGRKKSEAGGTAGAPQEFQFPQNHKEKGKGE